MKTVDESLRRWFTANRVRPTTTRRAGHPRPVRALLALAADEILRLHQRLVTASARTEPVRRSLFEQRVSFALNCQRHYRYDEFSQSTRNRWPVNPS